MFSASFTSRAWSPTAKFTAASVSCRCSWSGLYFSWLILLFGAQVAYAFQNRRAYLQDKLVENVNQRGREFIALRLMTCIGRRFQRGQPPATLQEISIELGIPTRLAQQVLQTLLAARLVVERSPARNRLICRPARWMPSTPITCCIAMRTGIGQELSAARRTGARGGLWRIRPHRGSRAPGRVVRDDAGAGQSRPSTSGNYRAAGIEDHPGARPDYGGVNLKV